MITINEIHAKLPKGFNVVKDGRGWLAIMPELKLYGIAIDVMGSNGEVYAELLTKQGDCYEAPRKQSSRFAGSVESVAAELIRRGGEVLGKRGKRGSKNEHPIPGRIRRQHCCYE